MSSSRELIKGSVWVTSGHVITLVVAFATNILLARMLDKDNWGIFATLMAVVSFLSTIADLGLNYSIFHRASSLSGSSAKSIRERLSTLFTYKLLFILLIGGAIYLSSGLLSEFFRIPGGQGYFEVSAVFFVVYNVFATIDVVFSGLKMFKEGSAISLAHNIFRLAFSYLLIVFGMGVNGALLGYLSAISISVLVQHLFVGKYISIMRDKSEDVKETLTYGFFFGIGSLATVIALWMDSIIIGVMMGATAVGVYRISLSIATSVGGLLGVVNKVFFPFLASSESKGIDSIGQLNTALKYGAFFAFPAMVGLAIASEGIVDVFYTSQYSDAVLPMIILSYVCFDMIFTSLVISYLGARKETGILASSSVAATAINFILNIVMIPMFGLVGAAFASIASRIWNAIVLILWSKSGLKEKIEFRNLIIPFLGSLVMGAVLFLASPYINPSASIIALGFFMGLGMAVYAVTEQALGFDVIGFGKKVVHAFV
ncbi:Polysaccharide biosynthesis protein [uncultured archaeon]|nr:Polysaccharide biosynthesis protein [uncultured archaeon]